MQIFLRQDSRKVDSFSLWLARTFVGRLREGVGVLCLNLLGVNYGPECNDYVPECNFSPFLWT